MRRSPKKPLRKKINNLNYLILTYRNFNCRLQAILLTAYHINAATGLQFQFADIFPTGNQCTRHIVDLGHIHRLAHVHTA